MADKKDDKPNLLGKAENLAIKPRDIIPAKQYLAKNPFSRWIAKKIAELLKTKIELNSEDYLRHLMSNQEGPSWQEFPGRAGETLVSNCFKCGKTILVTQSQCPFCETSITLLGRAGDVKKNHRLTAFDVDPRYSPPAASPRSNSSLSPTTASPKQLSSVEECGLCKHTFLRKGLIFEKDWCEIREIPTPFKKDWKCLSFSRK